MDQPTIKEKAPHTRGKQPLGGGREAADMNDLGPGEHEVAELADEEPKPLALYLTAWNERIKNRCDIGGDSSGVDERPQLGGGVDALQLGQSIPEDIPRGQGLLGADSRFLDGHNGPFGLGFIRHQGTALSDSTDAGCRCEHEAPEGMGREQEDA